LATFPVYGEPDLFNISGVSYGNQCNFAVHSKQCWVKKCNSTL